MLTALTIIFVGVLIEGIIYAFRGQQTKGDGELLSKNQFLSCLPSLGTPKNAGTPSQALGVAESLFPLQIGQPHRGAGVQ